MNYEDLKLEKLDIIILAGQSNAEGNGQGKTNHPYKKDERVLHMIDKNTYGIKTDERSSLIQLDLKYPGEYVIDIAEERTANSVAGNFGLYFSKEYAKNNLENGRKVLLIRAAYGGTGFAKNHWGIGDVIFNRMNDMVDYALSLNSENRIVAFLWHQGEHDAFENADISFKLRKLFYYEKFTNLLKNVKEKYSKYDFPIISGGIVDDWKSKNKEACKAIEDATKKVMKDFNGAFVSSKGLKSNRMVVDCTDDIHFCRSSLYTFGKRYYQAYTKLLNK